MRRGEDRALSLRPIIRQLERRRDGGVVGIAAGGAYGTGTRMLTLDELCAWLNITERHARKLVERDAIPYRKVGHLLRFPEEEIEEWSHPSRRPMPRNSVSRKEPSYIGYAMWRRYLALAHGYTASHKDGAVRYTAHELRHVCASLLIASGATDMQVTNQMGHSKIETTKNIYGHLFAQDRSLILKAINQAVSRLHIQESAEDEAA